MKQSQGWKIARVIIALGDEPVVGFHLLWRHSLLGRVGYVSKAPVIIPADPSLVHHAIGMLCAISRRMRLRALIVQPPDSDRQIETELDHHRFLPNAVYKFNAATWLVDLRNGFAAVEKGMNRSTRQNIRQARKRGVTVREGSRDDLDTFFGMMAATCQRQGVHAEPSKVEALRALWDAASPTRSIRLSIAENAGKPIAGLISLTYANRVTFWKKGWTTECSDLHPNELLMHEALEWSHAAGYELCDYAAMDRSIAVALLNHEQLTDAQKKSRHLFNVRLGGFPQLLPESRVYFPNPLVRGIYRLAAARITKKANDEIRRMPAGSSETPHGSKQAPQPSA